MKPSKISTSQSELFQNRLSNQLNPKDPLFILSGQIQWSFFEELFGRNFKDGSGQPPKPIRLMVGLMMLQHMKGLSDEEVVAQWIQNPYWQYFCGYDYLQWSLPCDPSSLTRWRDRIGEKGLEEILAQTIVTALTTQTVCKKDLKEAILDATVMEKNVTFPTDSKLLNKAAREACEVGFETRFKAASDVCSKRKDVCVECGKVHSCEAIQKDGKRGSEAQTLFGTCGARYWSTDQRST